MSRKTAPDRNIESKFWKPEKIGDTIEGEYIGCEEGKYGFEYVLKTSEGEKVLPAHRVLQAKMEDLKVGWYIWIEVSGYQQNKKGNPTTLYKVDYDDEYKHQSKLEETKASGKSSDPGQTPTQAHTDAKAEGIAEKIKQLTEDDITVTDGVLETITKKALGSNEASKCHDMIRILKQKGLIIRNDADTGWVKA